MSSTVQFVFSLMVILVSVLSSSETNLTFDNLVQTDADYPNPRSPIMGNQSTAQLLESQRKALMKELIDDNQSPASTIVSTIAPEGVVHVKEETLCEASNQFTTGCLVSAMVAWNLQVKQVSEDGSVTSLCNNSQSRFGCGLRLCCSGHLALKCLHSARQTCPEVIDQKIYSLSGITSKICPQNIDVCHSSLLNKCLESVPISHGFAYEVHSKEPMEMVKVAKVGDDIERITIHLRFSSGSVGQMASSATLSALVVITFLLK